MIRPCPNVSPCQSTDDPFSNLSSEAVDTLDFIDTRFQGFPGVPPLQKNWTATACGQTYSSAISALDAEMQALAAAILCDFNNGGGGPPVFNTPQVCCVPSFGGTQHCWTVPGGTIAGPNLGTANQRAQALACQLAGQIPNVTLSSIQTSVCLGSDYNSVIAVGGDNQPYVFLVDTTTLPPGITATGGANNTLTLSGTPNTAGTFAFNVIAESPEGFFVQRIYTVGVLGFTNGTPPTAHSGTPYTFTFTANGGAGGPFTFNITAGSLPIGLSMDQFGNVTGTPTNGGSSFTITVTDSSGFSCSLPVTIAGVTCGPDWTKIVWGAINISQGAPTGTFSGDHFNVAAAGMTTNGIGGSANATCNGTIVYNGPAFNGNAHIVMAGTTVGHIGDTQFSVPMLAPGLVLNVDVRNLPLVLGPGTYDIPFAVPDTGGLPVTIQLFVGWSAGIDAVGPPPYGAVSMTASCKITSVC